MENGINQLNKSKTAILLLAYRRSSHLLKIIDSCAQAGYIEIFVVVDRPKKNDYLAIKDSKKVREAFEQISSSQTIKFNFRFNSYNAGCAVSMIKGCDWVFSRSFENIIVLEDDCVPTKAFFSFIENKLEFIRSQTDIWLICGTQLVPSNLTQGKSIISKYPLSWGWATTSQKWSKIKEAFSPNRNLWLQDLVSTKAEKAFWSAGKRRALLGFTDVWDTAVVSLMMDRNKYAILPPLHLVSNLGNDEFATNVTRDSIWTQNANEPNSLPNTGTLFNPSVDEWIKHNIYKIGFRHVLSTKITLILDFIFRKKRMRFKNSLPTRLSIYENNQTDSALY